MTDEPSSVLCDRVSAQLVGIGVDDLDVDELGCIYRRFHDGLVTAVGRQLSAGLEPWQLDEFEELFIAHDDDGMSDFLEHHTPFYREVVERLTVAALDHLALMFIGASELL